MKITLLSPIIILLAVATAHAAGGAHDDHIPFDKIGWQAANLGILLIALFFALRKSIVDAFANRKQNFLNQAEKTKSTLLAAEAALSEARTRLQSLEAGEATSIKNAEHESNLLKAHIIKDAEAGAVKMQSDLQLTLTNELEKAKAEINALILNQAIGSATKKISSQGSQNAEASFLNQISQVKS